MQKTHTHTQKPDNSSLQKIYFSNIENLFSKMIDITYLLSLTYSLSHPFLLSNELTNSLKLDTIFIYKCDSNSRFYIHNLVLIYLQHFFFLHFYSSTNLYALKVKSRENNKLLLVFDNYWPEIQAILIAKLNQDKEAFNCDLKNFEKKKISDVDKNCKNQRALCSRH